MCALQHIPVVWLLTIYDSFSLLRCLAVEEHFLCFLSELSISLIPSGKLRSIFSVPHWVQSQRIGFFIIKCSNYVPVSVLLYCLNGWENTCVVLAGMWFKSAMCHNVSVWWCYIVSVFFSLPDQLPLACLTRYPVITSIPLLCFTWRAHSQPIHWNIAHKFRLFFTSLSSIRKE